MGKPIGAQAGRLLAALAEGGVFRRSGDGWAAGTLGAPDSLPDSLVEELDRRGLLVRAGAGLALTEAGRAWAARRAAGPRILAEGALPGDAETGRRRPARSVTVNLAESPLGWLKARGLVDARQFEAGERLRGDWTIAGMGPRVTMRWDAGARSTGGGLDPTLAQIAAKRRMEAALDAAGPGLKDVLWRIVCAGEGMDATERALGWPARAGRVVLTLGLDRLADFYGLG